MLLAEAAQPWPTEPASRPAFWATMLVAAVVVPRIAAGVYSGLAREVPPAFDLLAHFWLFMSVAAWFWGYCRARRVSWPQSG